MNIKRMGIFVRSHGSDIRHKISQISKGSKSEFHIYKWQGIFLVQIYSHVEVFLKKVNNQEDLNVPELKYLASQAMELLSCCRTKSPLKSLSTVNIATLGLKIRKNAMDLLLSFDSISKNNFQGKWEKAWKVTLQSLLDDYVQDDFFLAGHMDQQLLIPYLDECFEEARQTVLCKRAGLLLQMLDHKLLHLDHSRSQLPEYCPKVAYEDIREGKGIGEGNYGRVVEVALYGEKFACKKCTVSSVLHEEAVVHFKLQHPNIVRAICYVEYPETVQTDRFGLVMELMHPDNLRDFINKSNQPVDLKRIKLTVDVIYQVADAMRYLHSKKIMHRDLKARNILVDLNASETNLDESRLHVKLGDLGTARVVREGSTILTAKVGTSYWRAPEVRSGDGEGTEYSFKADVYSFGMTCYEVLTGRSPIAPKGSTEDSWRPELPDIVPYKLGELIKECWDTNPDKRPTFDEIVFRTRDLKIGLAKPVRIAPDTLDEDCIIRNATGKTIELHENMRCLERPRMTIPPDESVRMQPLEGTYCTISVYIKFVEDCNQCVNVYLDTDDLQKNSLITILKDDHGAYFCQKVSR